MSTVSVEQDHVFATVGETVLALDLYRAPQVDAPLVVYVHGGGWRGGDKADGGVARLRPMAAPGVTVASVNYRLVPGATFPDQLHDLKGAVRWLRAHGTSLGVPTGRVGIWGASAGAYLGSLLALTGADAALEGTVGGNVEQSSTVQPWSTGSASPTWSLPASATTSKPASFRSGSKRICSECATSARLPITPRTSFCSPGSPLRRHRS